jgi:hypothetical protein
MKIVKAIMLLAATFCMTAIGIFFVEMAKTARETQTLVADAQADMAATNKKVQAILLHLDRTAGEVAIASTKEQEVSRKTIAILDHADRLLTQTENNTNEITSHTVQAIDQLPPLLVSLRDTTEAAKNLVSDRRIVESLQNIDETTKQAAGAMDNVNQSTANLKKKTDELLKPASLSVRIATWTLRVLAGARDAFQIF